MPPLYRILEVALYSLLNFLPYIVLALYPFRNHLRFKPSITYGLLSAVSVIQIALGIWAGLFANGNAAIISAISTLIYFLFYIVAVNDYFGKLLFTVLMLSNIANFIVMLSKCIEGLLFADMALESYRYSLSLVMIFVQAAILIPLFFYIRNTVSIVFERNTAQPTWRFLWLIPATFYVIWFFQLYSHKHMSSLELALLPSTSFCS